MVVRRRALEGRRALTGRRQVIVLDEFVLQPEARRNRGNIRSAKGEVMRGPPNMRVQRTRSSPSALREPLTRRPLGRVRAVVLGRGVIAGGGGCPS